LNYIGVIKKVLAPAGGQRKAHTYEAEADNHIPRPDIWDWVTSLGYIEDNDPKKAYQEGSDHRWG
jgi:hypothetical protein